jgi:hypothetical protein
LRYVKATTIRRRATSLTRGNWLADQNFLAKSAVLNLVDMCLARLGPGDQKQSNFVPAEITLLRDIANKVPLATARTEILKAVAVLRDKHDSG